MSQSDVHRDLIMQVADEIQSCYPKISIITDLQQKPGDAVPPMISGFRPDVYAVQPDTSPSIIIAEAKTDGDLNNRHTEAQLQAFIRYLEHETDDGLLVLAVTGRRADQAKTLLWITRQINQTVNTTLAVYDSHDFWVIDQESGVAWHLN